jgi:hypothetical protein
LLKYKSVSLVPAHFLDHLSSFLVGITQTDGLLVRQENSTKFQDDHNDTLYKHSHTPSRTHIGSYRAPTPQFGLTNCTWFKPSSCCLPREETLVVAAIDQTSELFFHTSPQCQQHMNFLGCWPCHPEQV